MRTPRLRTAAVAALAVALAVPGAATAAPSPAPAQPTAPPAPSITPPAAPSITPPAAPSIAPPAAPAVDGRWTAPLQPGGDDTNVVLDGGELRLALTDGRRALPASSETDRPQGMLLTPPQRLAEAADRVSAELRSTVPPGAQVAVDVRGALADGTWTEWVEARPGAPAVLETAVDEVQTRVTLTAAPDGPSPEVAGVSLTADTAPRAAAPAPRAPASYRVFATREGLVGGTTANGHVITPRDHFAALPSRRGLAPRGTGDYSVKVCADNGRCEWAPVWDVGPWNTRDDYWNPGGVRQQWGDLPQGRPQAQAAYQNGYNGGKDQFGRRVANPAGIDLADGTFWDGLRLKDNAWVTVTYQWTGAGLTGTVRSQLLNVRSGPGTQHPAVGIAARHAQVLVECRVRGQFVRGVVGATDSWLRIGPNQFVSAAHVQVSGGGTC